MKPAITISILLLLICCSCEKEKNEIITLPTNTESMTELVAAFEVACPTFNKGIECALSDISTGDIIDRKWIVGEGELTNETSLTPNLKYETIGAHDITLIVFSDTDSDTTTRSIIVYPGDGLIAYYPLDSTALDFSGNEFHGTINETMLAPDLNDIENHAFQFTTPEDKIVTSTEIDDELFNGATFSAWIMTTDTIDYGSIISNRQYVGTTIDSCILGVGFEFFYGIERGIGLSYDNRQYDIFARSDDHENFGLNEWHHVLVTWNGELETGEYEFKTYIDGERTTGNSSGHFMRDTNCSPMESQVPFTIGSTFHGLLDELRIYNRPLDEDEIMMLYNR